MVDVIVIGGGPAGLTAALYLSRAQKKVLVVESEVFGGQIVVSPCVENYPGCPSISGYDLGVSMCEQARSFGAETISGKAVSIYKEKDIFHVMVGEKDYQSKAVIYAAGSRPRKLELLHEEELIGKGISYCAMCDGAFFKDKVVAVVGGGNTAILDAFYLANVCKKVYVIHRRDEFRAEPGKLALLKEKENVTFITCGVLQELVGRENLTGIVVDINGKKENLDVDGLFVAIGHVPNTSMLEDFVSLNPNGYILTNYQLATEVPGFFAAGDVCEKKIRQLTTATSDGTVAAMSALDYLASLER